MDITYQELVDMVRVEVLERMSAISGLATYDQRREYILDNIVYELMLCGRDLLSIAVGTRLMHENSVMVRKRLSAKSWTIESLLQRPESPLVRR